MAFRLVWSDAAAATFSRLQGIAEKCVETREYTGKTKASKQEGLFKQLVKCLDLLAANPRHPGLQSHEFTALAHPHKKDEKVFEAYAQHRTPGAYRVFWCYGPQTGEITILAITPHP